MMSTGRRISERSETSAASSTSQGQTGLKHSVLQFTAPIYYVEETEGSLVIDIMRLGLSSESSKITWETEDGSAKAGRHYKAASGEVSMEAGERQASIALDVIYTPYWNPTLEFKVKITSCEGGVIGKYLHTCRVKMIDVGHFPSCKYKRHLVDGAAGVSEIPRAGLFMEVFKLLMHQEGFPKRVILSLIFDQLKTVRFLSGILLQIYFVDNFLKTDESGKPLVDADTYKNKFQWVFGFAAVLLAPMVLVHIWDYFRVRLDLHGHFRTYFQKCLFRKCLNLSEESRQNVHMLDVKNAILQDANEVAAAFEHAIELFQIILMLAVLLGWNAYSNPSAAFIILGLPVSMTFFLLIRIFIFPSYAWKKLDEAEFKTMRLVTESFLKFELISDYKQRPRMNDKFEKVCHEFKQAEIPVKVSSDIIDAYAAKWIGPFWTAVYMAWVLNEILHGESEVTVGVFTATLAVLLEVGTECQTGFDKVLGIGTVINKPLQGLCELLNLETDLGQQKSANRSRRKQTSLLQKSGTLDNIASQSNVACLSDLVSIKVQNASLKINDSVSLFNNVNLEIAQGNLVAVLGGHGSGKATFLKMLAQRTFPSTGQVFVPSHLRALHVTQAPILLSDSLFENLVFGQPLPNAKRIRRILHLLGMVHVEEMVEDDLQKIENKQSVCHDAHEDFSWLDRLSYTTRVKIHLARALIMNPEVLVLQRPLHHYNYEESKVILKSLRSHVDERGLGFDDDDAHGRDLRRPRTCFLTVEDELQSSIADVVWTLSADNVQIDTAPAKLLSQASITNAGLTAVSEDTENIEADACNDEENGTKLLAAEEIMEI